MFAVNLKEVFDRATCDPTSCEGCEWLSVTCEEWGEDWECNGNKFDCPQVESRKTELEEFMANNPEEFELIMEIK